MVGLRATPWRSWPQAVLGSTGFKRWNGLRTTYGTDKADQDRRDKTSPGRRRRHVDIPNCKQQYVDAPKQQSALIGFWVRLAEAHQDSMIRNKGFVTQPVNFFFDV